MRRTIRAVVLGATAVLCLPGGALAATVETPPLQVGGLRARCNLANHGDADVFVSDATILNQNGGIAAVGGIGAVVPAHGAATLVEAAVQQATCRVRGSFAKSRVRVTLCSIAGSPNDGACLEAVIAP